MKNPTDAVEFFIRLNKPEKAKIVLDLLRPHAVTINDLDQLGKLYSEIKEFNDTLEIAHKMYGLTDDPQIKFDLRTNIIRSYLNLNKPEEALEYILINAVEDPNNHSNQMDQALVYFLLDKKDEGEQILRKILEEPHTEDIDNRVRYNLGTYNLRHGKFKEGLSQILLGLEKLKFKKTHNFSDNQQWTGEIIKDKTILLYAEGGIGDEIISVRFMKYIKELGMNPIWFTDRLDIAGIFNRCGFRTISNLTQLPEDWLWAYSMSIPCYLDLDEDDLWYGTYLTALNRSPLLEGKKKIGIKTTGNSRYEQDLHRIIPFNDLVDHIPEDYTIYSFHIEENFEHPRVISLKDKINNWNDTLDYINQMDIIVSSCTSLVHAAGALGKPAIVIVPMFTYYPWVNPTYHTKWYGDNLTILRQTQYNSWESPLNELEKFI